MFNFVVRPKRTVISFNPRARIRAGLFLAAALALCPLPPTRGADSGYTISTFAGRPSLGYADGPGTSAAFAQPQGVCVDLAGNVYVADSLNHVIRKITPTHVVTTLAGKPGEPGSADGTGRDAQFQYPTALVCDVAGNIYVADARNNTIRKVTPDGVVTTFAGQAGQSGAVDGAGRDARFSSPVGIAIDIDRNLYVADTQNATIRKITPDGVVSTLAGKPGEYGTADGSVATARFSGPTGIAIDAQGTLYISEVGAATIRVLTRDGVVSTLAGMPDHRGTDDGVGGAARFTLPTGLAIDGDRNLYVADLFGIRKITAGGAVTTFAGQVGTSGDLDGSRAAARFNAVNGLVVDAAGNLIVADTGNSTIRVINSVGVVSTLAGLSGSAGSANGRGGDARFTAPTGLATDATGNLYVAEGSLRTLRKISPDGTVTNFAGATGQFGSVDGVGTTARFGYPSSVATDAKGNVYVSDGDNFNIRKITPDGIVSTLAGATRLPGLKDGTGSEAQFSNPGGLAVDAAGNVYVAERDGPTIRKITPAGVVTTFAGRTGVGGSIDGPRGVACLVRPESIVIDQTGNFFVTDGSTTVRKITPEGAITTVAGRWQNPGTVDGPGSDARFVSASGLTIDPLGNLFVVELNGLVRRIDPSFVVTTLAGKAGSFGSSDGSGTAVRFNFPTAIAMDPGGDIYIADTDNNTIRKGVSNTRLVNLSVRAVAGSGDQTLIVGFVVAGALAPKPVLVRAVGPTLVDLGIINSLPNPRLKLYNVAGAPLRENDDWGGSAELRDLFASLGAYPLEAGSKDAAISTALTPGVYTAHVTSADASTGIALLETYDADRTSSARLVNASVRAVSGGGQNVVIAGFVLVGTAPKSVLVRAIGPSLVSHGLGLASLLQDPQLTLYNGSVMIGNNDDWGGAAALKSSFARVGAFVPDSETSKDAALLATLDPGLYSVVVSGGSNQAGVVLVEVYEMP